MPNLQGASPVARDREGRLYAERAVSRDWPNRRRRSQGEVLIMGLLMSVPAGHMSKSRELGSGGCAGQSRAHTEA